MWWYVRHVFLLIMFDEMRQLQGQLYYEMLDFIGTAASIVLGFPR